MLLAPLVGSTPISLRRVFDRSIPFADNVDAQIFFVARLPRVLAAALVGSGAGPRRASSSRRCCVIRSPRPTRSACRRARRSARCWPSPSTPTSRCSASRPFRWPASPARSARSPSSTASRRPGGAARPRSCCCWPGVTLTALLSAVSAFVRYLADFTETLPDRPLADGVARRRRLRAHRGGGGSDGNRVIGFAMLPRVLDL